MKHIALVLILLFASMTHAQNSCPLLFKSPPTLMERVQARVLPKRFQKTELEAEAQAIREDAVRAFRKLPKTDRNEWVKLVDSIAVEIQNPYKMEFDLHEAAEKFHTSARNEFYSLFRSLAFTRTEARSRALDKWTRSETHAVLLYKILSLKGLPEFAEELRYLREHNVFFSDTSAQKNGSLLTYSFEKEGRGKEISMLYRPAEMTEAEWFKKSDEERFTNLFTRQLRQKVFLPASVLAPTSLKPAFLRGFSFDGYNDRRSWEITHKGFEISLHRTLSEMKEIAQLTRETHSFHAHVVFEIEKETPHFDKFLTWFKVMNDALYLRGLEEGLHGHDMVGPVKLARDHAPGTKSRFLLNASSPSSVSYQSQKFFTAGLRGTLYGPASSPEYVKLGIELRDSTRSLEKLGNAMTEVSESLVGKVWEKLRPQDRTDYARIITDGARTHKLLIEAGLRPEIAEQFTRADETSALPFLKLEAQPLFNFKTGEYERAAPDYVARAEQARAKYIEGLLALQTEIDGFTAKGEMVEDVDLQLAIQQTLTEWARSAKPSQRFQF